MSEQSQPPSFPNLRGKHAHDPVFTPQDFVEFLRRSGRVPDVEFPEGVILCYQSALRRHIEQTQRVEPVDGRIVQGSFWTLPDTQGRVGVCAGFGIGAPVAVTTLEQLAALGVRRFISIGTAGALQRSLGIGDLVVCTAAVRDEGVSHHYLEPAPYASPSGPLTARLKAELDRLETRYVEGPAWTIDAPYRETVQELRHYQERGVLTVDMEASALFAVGQYRDVEVAAGFCISDSLADLVWNPQFGSPETEGGLHVLYAAAKAALS